jgi:HK97 family phage portal protein
MRPGQTCLPELTKPLHIECIFNKNQNMSLLTNILFPTINKKILGYWPDSLPQPDLPNITSEQVTAVMTSIRILADNMSKLPICVKNAEGQEVKEHAANNLLKFQSNNWQTSHTFIQTIESLRNYTGNAYARIRRDNNGFPKSLEILEISDIERYEIKNGNLYYWIKGVKTRAENVLHFKHFSVDGVLGLNPIELTRLNWESTGSAQSTVKNFYKNGMVGQLSLSSSVDYNQINSFQSVLKAWKDKAGHTNAGDVKILPPNSKLDSIPVNLKDAEFLSLIQANSKFIASMFGVPSHMITGETPKYSNVEQSLLDFRTNTLGSIIAMYRAELESKLLTTEERSNGITIEFDTSKLTGTDAKSQAEIDKQLLELGVITPNDLARKYGFPTYDGGDKHYLPFNNLQPVEDYNKEEQQTLE